MRIGNQLFAFRVNTVRRRRTKQRFIRRVRWARTRVCEGSNIHAPVLHPSWRQMTRVQSHTSAVSCKEGSAWEIMTLFSLSLSCWSIISDTSGSRVVCFQRPKRRSVGFSCGLFWVHGAEERSLYCQGRESTQDRRSRSWRYGVLRTAQIESKIVSDMWTCAPTWPISHIYLTPGKQEGSIDNKHH